MVVAVLSMCWGVASVETLLAIVVMIFTYILELPILVDAQQALPEQQEQHWTLPLIFGVAELLLERQRATRVLLVRGELNYVFWAGRILSFTDSDASSLTLKPC